MTPEQTLTYLMAVPGVTRTRRHEYNMIGEGLAVEITVTFGAQGRVQVCHYSDGTVRVVARNYVRRTVIKWNVDGSDVGPISGTRWAIDGAVKWALTPLEHTP